MNKSIIANKSFDFSKDIVCLYKYLVNQKSEYVMSKQLLRSGTSIGANVKEALRGQSKRDFLAKMYISIKEADETEYWIQLLMETEYIDKVQGKKVLNKCQEISKILNAILKTAKKNLNS